MSIIKNGDELTMVEILSISPSDKIIDKIASLYNTIWNSEDTTIKERIWKHSTYTGYKGIILLRNEEVVGFAYGYTSLPGQYYHEKLTKEFTSEEYNHWLTNCFEFVELAVHPGYRKQGFGQMLIKKLLQDVDSKTAVLTTQVNNNSARSLYESLNWLTLKEPFFPGEENNPYIILGKEL